MRKGGVEPQSTEFSRRHRAGNVHKDKGTDGATAALRGAVRGARERGEGGPAGWYSPKSAETRAAKNLAVPAIWAEVQRRQGEVLERAGVNAVRVLEELRRVAFSDVRELFTEAGSLKPVHEPPATTAAGVSSVEVVSKNLTSGDGHVDTIHKVKLWDKLKALQILAEHLSIVSDRDRAAAAPVTIIVDLPWAAPSPNPPATITNLGPGRSGVGNSARQQKAMNPRKRGPRKPAAREGPRQALTAKRQRFIAAYVEHTNGALAARQAGYLHDPRRGAQARMRARSKQVGGTACVRSSSTPAPSWRVGGRIEHVRVEGGMQALTRRRH